MRAVSLLPAATELLYALGTEPVGVSHECDYPPAARDLPTVVHTNIDSSASSGDIDEQVRQARESGGVFEIDSDRLISLDPDLVLTQGSCDVCAVDDSRIRNELDELSIDPEIVELSQHSLADVFGDLERLGEILDRQEEATAVRTRLESRIEEVGGGRGSGGESVPRVTILDWLNPVMVAAHWVPELIEIAGGEYGLADTGEHSRVRDWAEIREYDPDVLIVAPCGFDLEQIRTNFRDLTTREGWSELSAVRAGQVYAMDGDQYVNRPGPRLVDTLERIETVISDGNESIEWDGVSVWDDLIGHQSIGQ